MGTWINPKESDGEVVPSRQHCRDYGQWCCRQRDPFIVHGPTGGLLGDTKTCQVGTQPPEDIAAKVGETMSQLLWVSHRGDVGCGGLGRTPGLRVLRGCRWSWFCRGGCDAPSADSCISGCLHSWLVAVTEATGNVAPKKCFGGSNVPHQTHGLPQSLRTQRGCDYP